MRKNIKLGRRLATITACVIALSTATDAWAAKVKCENWEGIYQTREDESGNFSKITFLPSYTCPSCEGIALVQGYQGKKLKWLHQASYACSNGAGGCQLSVGTNTPSQSEKPIFITFVSSLMNQFNDPEILVLGGLFRNFWYEDIRLSKPDKTAYSKQAGVNGVGDVFYFDDCRPALSTRIRDKFSTGSDGGIFEVEIKYFGAWGFTEREDVYVNCNASFPQVKIEDSNYPLGPNLENPEEAPSDIPLGDIWKATCK